MSVMAARACSGRRRAIAVCSVPTRTTSVPQGRRRAVAVRQGRIGHRSEKIGLNTDPRSNSQPIQVAPREADKRPVECEAHFFTGTFRRNSSAKFWSMTITCSSWGAWAVPSGITTATRLPSGARSQSRAAECGDPHAGFVGDEGGAVHGVADGHQLVAGWYTNSCPVRDQCGSAPPLLEICHLPPWPDGRRRETRGHTPHLRPDSFE